MQTAPSPSSTSLIFLILRCRDALIATEASANFHILLLEHVYFKRLYFTDIIDIV